MSAAENDSLISNTANDLFFHFNVPELSVSNQDHHMHWSLIIIKEF